MEHFLNDVETVPVVETVLYIDAEEENKVINPDTSADADNELNNDGKSIASMGDEEDIDLCILHQMKN